MPLTSEQRQGLGVALNEATLRSVEVDPIGRRADVTLSVLSFPQQGPMPDERRVQLLLQPVGRVVASLRHGLREDSSARVEPFAIEQLLDVVQDFQGSIYGWAFFDISDEQFKTWNNRDDDSNPRLCGHLS